MIWHRVESEKAHTYAIICADKNSLGISIKSCIIVKPKTYLGEEEISKALVRNGFDLGEIQIELENKFEEEDANQ